MKTEKSNRKGKYQISVKNIQLKHKAQIPTPQNNYTFIKQNEKQKCFWRRTMEIGLLFDSSSRGKVT